MQSALLICNKEAIAVAYSKEATQFWIFKHCFSIPGVKRYLSDTKNTPGLELAVICASAQIKRQC